jgi:hypothetical protein
MASTWTDLGGVEYSMTGHVTAFDDDGVVYFDEEKEIIVEGWRERLLAFAERNHYFGAMSLDGTRVLYPAWVESMIERGEIEDPR